MKDKKTIAVIVSVVITILGGAGLSLATFFSFIKPLAITMISLGAVGTIFIGMAWILDL